MMIDLGAIFLLLNVLINSRFGRNVEEVLVDWSVESWHRFGIRFLAGLFWWFVDLFRRLMQLIERLMYAVDEWLRFKSGQSRLMMVLKGALGTVWFFIAYGIRFCVNLLIEPQLNPVKHVPWVTVSHKILAPMWIAMDLHGLLAQHMNAAMADVTTFLIVTLTPGIFGYLIWELKENWRLFAANRSQTLDPVLVGSHGEIAAAAAPAGASLRHDSQAFRQAPPRRAEGGCGRRRSPRGPQASRGAAPRRNRSPPLHRAGVHRLVQRKPRLAASAPAGGRDPSGHQRDCRRGRAARRRGGSAGHGVRAGGWPDAPELSGNACGEGLSDAARQASSARRSSTS